MKKQKNTITIGGHAWETERAESGICISGYDGPGGDMTIPETITGLPVTEIRSYAMHRKNIIRVTIPPAVVTIGMDAFSGNPLESVTMGANVNLADRKVFPGRLPLFYYIKGRKAGTYTYRGRDVWRLEGGGEFDPDTEPKISGDFNYLEHGGEIEITGYYGIGGDVEIPSAIHGLPVTVIGEEAFKGKKLTSIAIPPGVKKIRSYAFCSNKLTEIALPEKLETLEYGAFRLNCLTEVIIPKSITKIGGSVFEENELRRVTIPDSVREIGSDAFAVNSPARDETLEEITIGADVDCPFGFGWYFFDDYRKAGKNAGVYRGRQGRGWSLAEPAG